MALKISPEILKIRLFIDEMNFIGICMCHLMRAWPHFIWLLVDSSWLLLIQPDHYSINLICDVTNDMGFLYSLFQYKSDCTNVAKVIAFDRFQIMARDLTSIAAMTPTLSPAEPDTSPQWVLKLWVHNGSTTGPQLIHNGSIMGPQLVHNEFTIGAPLVNNGSTFDPRWVHNWFTMGS